MRIKEFLFGKKEKEITYEELDDWINEYLIEQNIVSMMKMTSRELKSKAKELRDALKELEEKEGKTQGYKERAISMYKDRKKNYVDKNKDFAENLTPPERTTQMKNFIDEKLNDMEQLIKNTNKSYYIIKEFQPEETNKVKILLKEIDNILSNGKEALYKANYDKLEEINQLRKEKKAQEQEAEKLKEQYKEIQRNADEYSKKKAKENNKVKELKSNTSYKEYQELEKKKKAKEKELRREEEKIESLISELKPLIKKKSTTTTTKYLKDPIGQLLSDTSNELAREAGRLKGKVEELKLKKQKEEKLKKALEIATKDHLSNIRENINQLKQDLEGLEKGLKNNVAKLNIDEHEGRIQTLEKNMEAEEDKKGKIQNQLERINPRLTKQKIRNKIKELDEKTTLKL